MYKRILPIWISCGLLLSACSQDKASFEEMDQMGGAGEMLSVRADMRGRKSAPMPQTSAPARARMLAYRFSFSFSIPAKNLSDVAQRAVQSCQDAGLDRCQIVHSSLNQYDQDQISASLSLRVDPKWFENYRQSLAQDSKQAGGKMTSSNVSAEDLSIAISDADARLSSLQTLRTRLQNLLETKGSTVKDLMAVERELARVQGQIESSTARLRILRTRVSMSVVDIEYQSKPVAASRSAFRPIAEALTNFTHIFARALGGLIECIAFVLPWLFIGLPILWVVRRFWRRRRTTKKAKK